MPAFLPDVHAIRNDLLNYYFEVQRFERIWALDSLGRLHNTMFEVTADNGIPFPRAKANVYDGGSHISLAISWGDKIKG